MPEPIKLKPHLTTGQIYKRYRDCRHHQEKLRWWALYLISGGLQASQAARRVGRSSAWMTKLARRYNQTGPDAMPKMMQMFLDEFARLEAKGKPIVMVMDQATAHRAKALKVPERITIEALPPYRPELNPTERLWPLVKEGVAKRTQESMEELEQMICACCQAISKQPAQVSALTNYHWWPTV